MQTAEIPRGTVFDTSDPHFTEEEICAAANGPQGNNHLAVIRNLYRGRGRTIQSYADADREVKLRIKELARQAVTRYHGIYCLVSPAGNIGAKSYRGLAAAETGAWFSGGSSRIVLLLGYMGDVDSDALARFLGLFPEDEALSVKLLSRRLRQQGRTYRDTPSYCSSVLNNVREILAQPTATS